MFNPLNAKFNPICHLLALVGTHPISHVSRISVNKIDFKIFGLVIIFNHISGQQTNDNLLLNLLLCKCVYYEKARH